MDTGLELRRGEAYHTSRKALLLTILFSDIVGYTQLYERLPEVVMADIRNFFVQRTTYHIRESHGGLIVKRNGDDVFAVFTEPASAILATLNLHRELDTELIAGQRLQLRSSIHLGQVAVEQLGGHLDVFGRHINHAARVRGVAKPGEILVTAAVEDSVRGWIDTTSICFFRRRTPVLKGLGKSMTVFSVEWRRPSSLDTDSQLPESSQPLTHWVNPPLSKQLLYRRKSSSPF